MSKVFVLRTHALLSSADSTLRFGDDNEIVIPLAVLDEVRMLEKGSVEKEKISRAILEYINSFPIDKLVSEGVRQENGSILRVSTGFQDIKVNVEGKLSFSDLRTLQICLGIMQKENKKVILVTNNLILQFRAKSLGINAEIFKDETFPRLKEQYTGRGTVYTTDGAIQNLFDEGYINISDIYQNDQIEFIENKFFLIKSESNSALGIFKCGKIELLKSRNSNPYGIRPKNVGQKFMIEALLDDDCPLVVIKGSAGTGKTYCALAAGLAEIEGDKYSRILVTRSVTATEQYGFLPGDIEDKLSPYLAGITDNLRILIHGSEKKNKGHDEMYEDGKYFFEKGIVQIQAIGFLRGRSIVDTYFIIDETQNIEPDTIKSIVTRAAEGSKFIFLGDPTQIDNPHLTERYNGLVYLSEKMKGNPLCVQISLEDNESVRSNLAREAAKIL